MCGICFNRTQFDVKKGFDELIGKYSVKNLNHRLHFLKGDAAALITDLAATETDIPVKQKLIIYRIIREAFENIERHWRATHVEFELTHEDQTLKL